MAQQPTAALGRIATLDILRLVAALSVLFFHYLFRGHAEGGYLAEGYPESAPVALYGYLGVNLFFLISGFVIAWSAEGRSPGDFAVARFARLYPGFVVCMTVTFVVLFVVQHPAMPASPAQWFANLAIFSPAFGQPFMDGVYWSIVLELIFYGWVALAILAGLFDRHRLTLVTIWLALCAANEFWLQSGALRLLLVTEYGALFAAGILMHHIATRGWSAESAMLIVAAFLVSCNTMTVGQSWMLVHYGTAVPLAGLVLSNLAIHLLMAAAIRFRDILRPSATVAMLGGLTYPLYLLHQHIGYVAIDALAPLVGRWAAVGATTAAMLALSWVGWRCVETPLRPMLVRLLAPAARLVDQVAARIPRAASHVSAIT